MLHGSATTMLAVLCHRLLWLVQAAYCSAPRAGLDGVGLQGGKTLRYLLQAQGFARVARQTMAWRYTYMPAGCSALAPAKAFAGGVHQSETSRFSPVMACKSAA